MNGTPRSVQGLLNDVGLDGERVQCQPKMDDMERSDDVQSHEGTVTLRHAFDPIHEWLRAKGEITLTTAAGTGFTACAELTKRGSHAGEPVIRFFQGGAEYGRAYGCCWGHYYNCNRTRIGMYCKALDSAME